MPSYFLGFMGMTRRLNHFNVPEWRPFLLLEMVGVLIILCGVACQVMQLVVSIRKRHENRDHTGDPWTDAHWNGLPRRRRRSTTSPSSRWSTVSTRTGE